MLASGFDKTSENRRGSFGTVIGKELTLRTLHKFGTATLPIMIIDLYYVPDIVPGISNVLTHFTLLTATHVLGRMALFQRCQSMYNGSNRVEVYFCLL